MHEVRQDIYVRTKKLAIRTIKLCVRGLETADVRCRERRDAPASDEKPGVKRTLSNQLLKSGTHDAKASKSRLATL